MDDVAGFLLQRDEPADDAAAALGVQHPEGEVFQFLAHPLHAHAPGEGSVDLHRFARLLDLLFRPHGADGAHVVQPVGELDQDHAQVPWTSP